MDANSSGTIRRRISFKASRLGKAKALSVLKKSSKARVSIRRNIALNTMHKMSSFVEDNI